jgi:hypothetical protein
MKVAQHFSAGLALKKCVRPVRDDSNDRLGFVAQLTGRTQTAVYRPYRDASVPKHQPSTEVLGYFHQVPPGPILSVRLRHFFVNTQSPWPDALRFVTCISSRAEDARNF